jgi:hypothetical protein
MDPIGFITTNAPIIALMILFIGTLGVTVFWGMRRNLGYTWLIAIASSFIALLLVLFSYPSEAHTLVNISWEPQSYIKYGILLSYDRVAWSFLVALGGLALSVIVTDVVKPEELDWSVWAGSLFLAGLGFLGILAGNPLTLLLAWSAVDIADVLVFLWHIPSSNEREKIVISFFTRLSGSVLLVFASIYTHQPGEFFGNDTIQNDVSLIMIIAAGLRLGVLPIHLPQLQESTLRRGLGTILRLVPAATSLVLLARTATPGLSPTLSNMLLLISGLTALIASFLWITSNNSVQGRPYWILGISAFALAAAIRGQPEASLAWGLVLIFSGAQLFLVAFQRLDIRLIVVFGIWSLSLLPFSPGWRGAMVAAGPFNPILVLFTLAHGLFLAGYLRHGFRTTPKLTSTERWIGLVFPIGLAAQPVLHLIVGLYPLFREREIGSVLNLPGLLTGPIGTTLVFGLWLLNRRMPTFGGTTRGLLRSILSLGWFYKFFWGIYRSFGRLLDFISRIYEGEGGVLWAFLFLILLLAFLLQSGMLK